MSDRLITAIGLALGAAIVGIPIGVYAAKRYRCDEPAKTYDQAATITNIQTKLRGARR